MKKYYRSVFLILLLHALLAACSNYILGGGQATATYGNSSDQQIKARIIRQFVHDPAISAGSLQVQVTQGHVVLAGTVAKPWMIQRVRVIAGSVQGVRSVKSRVRLR